ncbi:MAG: phosphoribosyltransferase family protein, partial [bacterium]|nr:phosphoribosyltransferase family protein [bacterium]
MQAFFIYKGAIKEIIKEAKFGCNEIKARSLISYWKQKNTKSDILHMMNTSFFDAVCFIPIHWRRRIWRGFDLTFIFAEAMSRTLKVPLQDLLISKQFNKPLTLAQNKVEREKIIKNRFELKKSTEKPLKILLVDDIVTTGITLHTAATILRNDGHQIF